MSRVHMKMTWLIWNEMQKILEKHHSSPKLQSVPEKKEHSPLNISV